jgi:hypothetical protein
MTDDRNLALALSDLTEEHLLAITHAMRTQRDGAHEQGNERLAEVFGSILSLAVAAAVSDRANMLDDADFRDHVARALVAVTDRDRRLVRRIAVQTRQLAVGSPTDMRRRRRWPSLSRSSTRQKRRRGAPSADDAAAGRGLGRSSTPALSRP